MQKGKKQNHLGCFLGVSIFFLSKCITLQDSLGLVDRKKRKIFFFESGVLDFCWVCYLKQQYSFEMGASIVRKNNCYRQCTIILPYKNVKPTDRIRCDYLHMPLITYTPTPQTGNVSYLIVRAWTDGRTDDTKYIISLLDNAKRSIINTFLHTP